MIFIYSKRIKIDKIKPKKRKINDGTIAGDLLSIYIRKLFEI